MKKLKTNNANILSIVLVLFLVLINMISLHLSYLTLSIKNYQQVALMMKEKNLEILLTKYYLDTERDDILFSDEYIDDDIEIEYTVDILQGEEIYTTIHFIKEDISYRWSLCFDPDNMHIIWCNYV